MSVNEEVEFFVTEAALLAAELSLLVERWGNIENEWP